MKKITSKQIFTYVALLCIIIIGAVYMFVYKKNMEEAKAIEASNVTLAKRVASLKTYYDNEKMYKEEMEPMKEEIAEILEPYPAMIKEDDIIMQAVYTQVAAPIQYSSVNVGGESVLKAVSADVVTKAAIEGYDKKISFKAKSATLPNEVDYENLKVAIQSLYDSNYMIGIRSLTYAKGGEDGKLSGNMDLVFYSVDGVGKEYVAPVVAPYVSGTENIFGNVNEEED